MNINWKPTYIPGDLVYNHKEEVIRITSSYLKGNRLFYYKTDEIGGSIGCILEEALNLLARDPDTHKYNHRFFQSNTKSSHLCAVCQGNADEHIDIIIPKVSNKLARGESEDKKLISSNSNINNGTNTSKILTSANNYDVSQVPLINDNTGPISLISEQNAKNSKNINFSAQK